MAAWLGRIMKILLDFPKELLQVKNKKTTKKKTLAMILKCHILDKQSAALQTLSQYNCYAHSKASFKAAARFKVFISKE